MKTKLLSLLALLLVSFCSTAQTQFWSDNFEDAGAPTSGTRATSIAEFGCFGPPYTAYFKRTDVGSIALQNGPYTNIEGSKFFATEDIDRGPSCGGQNSVSANQQVTWTGINISGKTGITFKGVFAANNVGTVFQGVNSGNPPDYMIVEYSIDGGAWTPALALYANNGATGGALAVDGNGDQIGEGTALSYAFTELNGTITGTGTTLSLRLNTFNNGTGTSEMAFDNFRLSAADPCTAPSVGSNAPNRTICAAGSTTFPIGATGTGLSYQWQVNPGTGTFGNISNGGVYSNATTTSLSVTGATASMSGYTYKCVVTGTCGSATSTASTLTVSSPSGSIAKNDVSCFGGNNGSATVTPGGGISPYTYSWSPGGSTSASISTLTANTYTVTITDNIGCTGSAATTISQPTAALTASISAHTDILCNGAATGSATVLAGSGTPGYTYSWSPGGATTATATGLTAQNYTVTVTDAKGCTKTASILLTQPSAALTASISAHTDVLCNGAATGAATVLAGNGTAGYTYLWSPGGATTATISGLTAQTYSVTVTDANGCTQTASTPITQPTAALTASISDYTDVLCNGNATGSATVLAGNGTAGYTYLWSPGGATTATISGLTAQTYTVTVTDAHGCTKTASASIIQPTAALTASISAHTDVLCNGSATGSATVLAGSGTAGYTYFWSPGGATTATISNVTAQTYTVTVTDANGCTKTASSIISQPNAIGITPTQTNVSCNGGANGTATATVIGGTGNYTYSWSPGGATTATATGLSAQTYTVTVTDSNNCTKTQSYTITEPPVLNAISSQTDIACNGGSTGVATVTPSGGTPAYTYAWSPNTTNTTASATGLTAQTYTITVTDAKACTKIVNVTINQSPAISITPSQNNVSCNGGTNGTATAIVTGGSAPYTYLWTSGGTNATTTGLAQGGYSVTVTDFLGCTKTQAYTISQPAVLTATISAHTNVACNGAATGSATVLAGGGTSPYFYSWSPISNTTATATGLSAQTYIATVIDNNGCSKTANAIITQPATPLQVTASNDTNSCSGVNVTLNATATGGSPAYTYTWNPGNLSGASPTVNPTVTTTYIVTATDTSACSKTDTVIVSVGGVLAQSNQNNSTSITGSDTSSSNVVVGAFTFLYNDDCKIIASVKSDVGLGLINGNVNVIDSIPNIAGRPYLSRVYEVTPQNNIPGNVNLYYTQQDFDNYNAYATAHSIPLLPQNPTDQIGIDSIVITKISGTNFETGSHMLIHPDSVKWNAALHFWTVSIQVPSFSFFLLHGSDGSNAPLAINLVSFVAKKENKTTGLYWTTATEQSIVGFGIERSADGKAFEAIGNVTSKANNGNSATPLTYNFTDKSPLSGMNFYRLAETDKAGKVGYSDVRTVNFNSDATFNCYPNPTSGIVVIEHNADNDAQYTVRFTDVLGKVVFETKMPVSKGFNKSSIDMGGLSQGLYNMSIVGSTSVIYNTRIVKN